MHELGAGSIWEIFVPSVQFCCVPKISLKNSLKKVNDTYMHKSPEDDAADF